jgi:hypothetical protein
MIESRETKPIRPAVPEEVMRNVKYMLLITLVLGAATLADGIEVLRVEGIEVLSTGESIVMTHVSHVPPGAVLQGVMVIDGIEVLAEMMPVPPEGGMFPMLFPITRPGNRIELRGPGGELFKYIEVYDLD